MESISILEAPSTRPPKYFFDDICDTDPQARNQHFVTSLVWYKERGSPEHEFVVAHLNNSRVLRVERAPDQAANSNQVLFTSSSSSSKHVAADDTVRVIDNSTLASYVNSGFADQLAQYKFHDFRILEFARLVGIVSKHSPDYKLNGTMCYWFSSTIMAASKSLFHGRGHPPSPRAGKIGSLRAHTDDPSEIAEIMTKYNEAKKADPDPIGPREARHRREEEATQEHLRYLSEQLKQAQERVRRLSEENEALKRQHGG